MIVGIASDHGGYEIKQMLKERLMDLNLKIILD